MDSKGSIHYNYHGRQEAFALMAELVDALDLGSSEQS